MFDLNVFCPNLKRVRKAAGLSQKKLSELAGKGPTYIVCLENKYRVPKPDEVQKLAVLLKVELSELVVAKVPEDQNRG